MSSAGITPEQGKSCDNLPIVSRLYDSAGAGLKHVRDDFLYWTGKLTDSSFQLSLALIAGNWAVFGSVQKIASSSWAKASLALVIVTLGLSLVGCNWMGYLHKRQIDYAAKDPAQWEKDFVASYGQAGPWPYTKGIEWLGSGLRKVKTWLPLLSGVCFLVALFRT